MAFVMRTYRNRVVPTGFRLVRDDKRGEAGFSWYVEKVAPKTPQPEGTDARPTT